MAETIALPVGPPVPLDDEKLHALQAFVIELVEAAAPYTLEHFRRPVGMESKVDGDAYDPVTEADRSAEAVIRERIRARFPEHGILGEEHGYAPGRSPLTWVIDPIDGTRAFVTGLLHWGILVALYDGARPVLGAMHQPFTGELFVGSRHGTWLEHRSRRVALRTRGCTDLARAALCCTTPAMFKAPGELEAFERLASRVRIRRYGSDCYAYCMLAHGLVDLVVESDLHAYDVQALIPIVEAAGGVITDWDGGDAARGGAVIAAGDRALHREAIALLGPR